MEYLPDEVLIMIFDYLPSHILCGTVSRVCRRWDYLSSRRVALVRCPETFRRWCQGKGVKALFLMIQDPMLPSSLPFLPCAAYLTQLTIHLCLPLGSNDLILLSQLRLQHVDVFCKAEVLSDAAVPLASRVSSFVLNEPAAPGFLRAVAKRAQLKALHMYGRAGNYPREEMNQLLDSHCHRFEELTLRCPNLKEADYAAIGRCTALYSLKLYCCWEITPTAAMHLTNLQNLRKLHLTGTRRYLDSASLLRVIHRLPPGLAELSLSASRLGDEHAAALGLRAARLRVLELWRTLLTPPALLRLARLLTNLQELDLDMSLNRRHLLQLQRHPRLHTVRCQLPQEKFETRLRLLPAEDSPTEAITGLGGAREGGRARLLYYWAQDLPPLHVPPYPSSPSSPVEPPQHMLQF